VPPVFFDHSMNYRFMDIPRAASGRGEECVDAGWWCMLAAVTNSRRCCWRHCRLKATEMDLAPEFPFCTFHRDCGEWMMILDWLGAAVAPRTAPFLLPCLVIKRLEALGTVQP